MAKRSDKGSGVLKKLLMSLFMFLGLALAIEGGASLFLAWRDVDDSLGLSEEAHCDYDPLLGWSNRKSHTIVGLYGPQRDLTTNARGFRATEEHTPEIPNGRYRIVCLGDSFTLGYGVDDDSTYPAQMEALRPTIQTVNMGQGGYGVDQCALWYQRDGAALDVDLVLLVFIAPDFDRITERRFNGEYPKPFLELHGDELVLAQDPVPDDWTSARGSRRIRRFFNGLAVSDLLRRLAQRGRSGSRPAGAGTLVYAPVAERLIADLAGSVQGKGARLALVQIPLSNRSAGRPDRLVAWLAPYAASLDVPLLDLTGDFDQRPAGERDALYAADGHLNPLGNRFVAETLLRRLDELSLLGD